MTLDVLLVAGAAGAGSVLAVLAAVRPELNNLRQEMRDLASLIRRTEPGDLL